MKEKRTALKKKQKKFTPPPSKLLWKLTRPFRAYFTPQFFGLENVDKDKPALYVSNHSVYGVTDASFFMMELYKKKDIYLRVLADNNHFEIPLWNDMVKTFGLVPGSRENCSSLMQDGEHILVYPGGGRETFKHKGEKHKVIWKRRVGFAQMAIEHGYDIIPVASIGGDDAYDILADSQDILDSLLGRFIIKSGWYEKLKQGEYLPPISKGLLWSAFPKPVKLYTAFGKRIETRQLGNDFSEENAWQIRREVELEMHKKLIELLEYRKKDDLPLLRKLLVRF